MTISLPESIATFFDVCNGADIARLPGCFTHDAVVKDEGEAHQGHQAIESWLKNIQELLQFSTEPLSVSVSGNRVTVTTKVTGNFKGSPIQNNHIFTLNNDKIESLEIK